MVDNLLELHRINKSFPGVQALAEIDLDLRPGEVHILLGENGAGKSTLIKILSGVYLPDSGAVVYKGEEVRFGSPGDAQRLGISVIYQEPNLIPHMTVAENIFLGNEPSKTTLFPMVDENRIITGALKILDDLNLALDPYMRVSELNLVEKQMVAIARALHLSADLVIMDEPTSMLSQREVSQLFGVIRRLRSHGIGIIYVTHRLEEALQIGDRTTILRDGRKVATLVVNETTQADLIKMIVGRDVEDHFVRTPRSLGAEILRLEQVSSPNGIKDISFDLHAGEILGITGLIGSGGTRILRAIFGADPISAGYLFLDGKPVKIGVPQDAIALGVGLLTEDRQGQGLILEMNAQENMTLASLDNISSGPLIDHQAENNIGHHYAKRLKIREGDLFSKARFLSGGTQQKLVLSRWLASQCRVLLLDEPTRGIDVGARAEFYRLIDELSRREMGMILVSSNLPEILSLSNRIAVLRQGRLIKIVSRATTTLAELLALSSGGTLL
jgi:ribose transport system ATP-binding protein